MQVTSQIQVIKETYSKIKVFFIGLIGGLLGGGTAVAIYVVVDLYLL